MKLIEKHCLYIVATPIGNLGDITYRAVETLTQVDAIICEDTRVTGNLVKKLEIPPKALLAHYKNQEARAIPEILNRLEEGQSLALVSDAGTPGISDPGNYLISKVVEAGYTVVPIPGPTALTTLLSTSHHLIPHFYYEGFLPHKKGRQTRLKYLASLSDPVVIYESTHRFLKCLDQILEFFGDREILVGRELTKLHETLFRGKCSEAIAFFAEHSIKGEFVLVVFPK